MAELAKNPLKKHYKGLPCMLGEVVGRIVGEHESGNWGEINGEKCHSVPLLGTPHGSVIKSGKFYLDEITEEGLAKLKAYENEVIANNDELYGGKLTEEEWKRN